MASLGLGDRVIVHGLSSSHNDVRAGRVVSIVGPRISVQLRRSPSHLLVGSRVRLAKLKKDADLNGKVGMVVQAMEWVGGKRLAVELDDKSCNHGHHSGKPYMVKPCHLEVTSADHLRAASAAPAITPIVREEHRLDLTSDEDEEFEEAPPQEPLKQQQPRRDAAEETAPVAARWGEVAVCERWQVLRGDSHGDRAVAIQLQALAHHRGLRVARPALDQLLPGGGGGMPSPLVLLVASFVETGLVFPHQFSGYAGAVRPEFFWYDKAAQARPFAGPMDAGEDYMPALLSCGAAASTPKWADELAGCDSLDFRPRIDCGAAAVGVGQAAFCGGVGTHPSAAYSPTLGHGFYRTAVLYDSLFDEWVGLPPMRRRRHGAAAAAVGRTLFVLGGHYVEADLPVAVRPADAEVRAARGEHVVVIGSQPAVLQRSALGVQDFCEVLDLDKLDEGWTPLPAEAYAALRPGTRQAAGSGAAFFPAAALGPRVVCRLEVPLSVDPYAFPRATLVPVVLAYDTARPAAGWQEVWATPPEQQGSGASGCAHGGAFVLASGRPSDRVGRSASAFALADQAALRGSDSGGATTARLEGEWRALPPLDAARGGGALVSVHGRLFCLGGCDEAKHTFLADAEELVVAISPAASGSTKLGLASGELKANKGVALNRAAATGSDEDDGEWWAEAEGAALAQAAEAAGATWRRAPWVAMPRALHAHAALALPRLDWLPR